MNNQPVTKHLKLSFYHEATQPSINIPLALQHLTTMAPKPPETKPLKSPSSPAIANHDAFTLRCAELQALKKYTGWSNNECFRKMGIARRTGYRMLSVDSTVKKEKGNAGRPPKITAQQVLDISAWLDANYDSRTSPWEDVVKEFSLSCSWATVRRTLKRSGWPKCQSCQKGHATPARKPPAKETVLMLGDPMQLSIPQVEPLSMLQPNPLAVSQPLPLPEAIHNHNTKPVPESYSNPYPETYFEERPAYPEPQADPYSYGDRNPYANNPYPSLTGRTSHYQTPGD